MDTLYCPLDTRATQIRLLRLLPHNSGRDQWYGCENVQCELVIVSSLENAPPYEALSYAWGSPSPSDSKTIQINGRDVQVTQNLAYALAGLRNPDVPRLLWIDALCINQDDLQERSHQVAFMGSIYRCATQVLVWLGRQGLEADSTVADAVNLLRELGKYPMESRLPRGPPTVDTAHEAQFDRWINEIRQECAKLEEAQAKALASCRSKAKNQPPHTQPQQPKRHAKAKEASPKKCRVGKHCGRSDRKRKHFSSNKECSNRLYELSECWASWERNRDHFKLQKYQKFLFQERLKELKAPGSDEFVKRIQEQDDTRRLVATASEQLAELNTQEAHARELQCKLEPCYARLFLYLHDQQREAVWKLLGRHSRELSESRFSAMVTRATRQLQSWLSSESNARQEVLSMYAAEEMLLSGMGQFQRFVESQAEQLEKLKEEWSRNRELDEKSEELQLREEHLAELKRHDGLQRRQLAQFRRQTSRLQGFEDLQDRRLRELEDSQDEELERFIADWDHDQEVFLEEQWGDRRDLEAAHCLELRKLSEHHYKSLEALAEGSQQRCEPPTHKSQGVLGFPKDALSLREEELKLLTQLRAQRRKVHLQRVKLRQTKLQLRVAEQVPEQYKKWTHTLYTLLRQSRSIPELLSSALEELLDVQSNLVQYWNDWRKSEQEKWIASFFRRLLRNNPGISPNMMLLNLDKVCQLPYWRRLWIVQEVVLANRAIVYFGDDARTSVDWDIFTKAQKSLDTLVSSWTGSSSIGDRLHRISKSLPFKLDRLRDGRDHGWSLHQLLEFTEKSLCKDPRDKVYGLLGIAKDLQRSQISVSYKKPLGEVYIDFVRWHSQTSRRQQDCLHPIRFSQLLQLSFQGHTEMDGSSSQLSQSIFAELSNYENAAVRCRGDFKGAIFPMDLLLTDGELLQLRQQDLIGVLLDYFDTSGGFYESRLALEQRLLHLDSITTPLNIRSNYSAYSTNGGNPNACSTCTKEALKRSTSRIESQFFVSRDGEFGVASSKIREGDILYQFENCNLAVILRPCNGHYMVVSRAILPPDCVDSDERDSSDLTLSHLAQGTEEKEHAGGQREPSLSDESLVEVHFDARTLQELAAPLHISTKHKDREPLCIQESSFGWYEFVNYGVVMEDDFFDDGIPTPVSPVTRQTKPTSFTHLGAPLTLRAAQSRDTVVLDRFPTAPAA